MYVQKIIKVYFIFVMAVASLAVLSLNKNVESVIVSTFHAGGLNVELKPAMYAKDRHALYSGREAEQKSQIQKQEAGDHQN